MNSDVQTAVAVLRDRIRVKEHEIIGLKRMVNELSGEETYAISESNETGADLNQIRSDAFYGQTISGSAKMYLEMRKASGLGAASVNDIFAALKKGGFPFEAKDEENAKNGLRVSLRKNSTIFHRISANGDYGLLNWYPKAKAQKDDEPDEQASAAKKNGKLDIAKKTSKRSQTAKIAAAKKSAPAEQKQADQETKVDASKVKAKPVAVQPIPGTEKKEPDTT